MDTKRVNTVTRIFNTPAMVAQAAADRIALIAEQAFSTRGRFTMALSGGSTPRALYELLASPEYIRRIDWPTTYLFWSDERAVPPESRESNYYLALETLLNRVRLPQENIYRIHGERPAPEAAADYDRVLHEFFETRLRLNEPRFDVLLLGMGEDGHTASLFPNTHALGMKDRWVVPNRAPAPPTDRITLTYPAINAAAHIFFLVAGGEKAEAVARVFADNPDVNATPAAGVQPTRGDLKWMLDEAAAARIIHEDPQMASIRATVEGLLAVQPSTPANTPANTPASTPAIKPLGSP